jgi:hypothetical protein
MNDSRKERFEGKWRASSGQVTVSFSISRTARSFRIDAVDESDGEKLVVSRIKWDGAYLSFETRTPSNGWRTKNRLKVISKQKALQELTYFEKLERVT